MRAVHSLYTCAERGSSVSSIVAKILIEGDKHFCSKNHGGHRDYPSETLYYARLVSELIKSEGVTHYINAGDFTYGRFDRLEYRAEVDKILRDMSSQLNGNVWFLKGNHDSASYGTTEFEYYAASGWFKTSETLDFALGTTGGGLHLEMKDFGDYSQFNEVPGAINLLVTHGFFTFDQEKRIMKPNTIMAEHEPWKGIDMLVCGHIHTESFERGHGFAGKDVAMHYLPCLSRPEYIRNGMQAEGSVDIFTVYDDGSVNMEQRAIKMLPLETSFDIEAIKAADMQAEENERVAIDVSDIAKKMEEHTRVASDPIAVIAGLPEVAEPVKRVAIELIKMAKA